MYMRRTPTSPLATVKLCRSLPRVQNTIPRKLTVSRAGSVMRIRKPLHDPSAPRVKNDPYADLIAPEYWDCPYLSDRLSLASEIIFPRPFGCSAQQHNHFVMAGLKRGMIRYQGSKAAKAAWEKFHRDLDDPCISDNHRHVCKLAFLFDWDLTQRHTIRVGNA